MLAGIGCPIHQGHMASVEKWDTSPPRLKAMCTTGTPSTQPGAENQGDRKGGRSADHIQPRIVLSSVLL